MGWYSNISGTAHHHDPDDADFDASVWDHPPPKPRARVMDEHGKADDDGDSSMKPMERSFRRIEPIKPGE